MPENPLDEVFVKKVELDPNLLKKMIVPFAEIDPETAEVVFKEAGEKLTAKHKIIVFLLCRLAFVSVHVDTATSKTVTPKEIGQGVDSKGGTVRPMLAQLVDQRIILKDGDGYLVRPSSLNRAYKELERVLPSGE